MIKKNEVIKEISRHLPVGKELPKDFELLFELPLFETIGWSDIECFQLKPSSKEEIVPFFCLGDGGILAFWYFKSHCTIAFLGSEGELEIIADRFESFLQYLITETSKTPEEEYFFYPGNSPIKFEEKDYFNETFSNWYEKHTTILKPDTSIEGEKIRRNIMKIALAILDDGLSRVYTRKSNWWSLYFKITKSFDKLTITYLSYGKWYILPDKYGLEVQVQALLKLVKNKNKKEYELSVDSPGIVSIDNETELLLIEENT